jgi:hypothetical protein
LRARHVRPVPCTHAHTHTHTHPHTHTHTALPAARLACAGSGRGPPCAVCLSAPPRTGQRQHCTLPSSLLGRFPRWRAASPRPAWARCSRCVRAGVRARVRMRGRAFVRARLRERMCARECACASERALEHVRASGRAGAWHPHQVLPSGAAAAGGGAGRLGRALRARRLPLRLVGADRAQPAALRRSPRCTALLHVASSPFENASPQEYPYSTLCTP